MKNMFYGKLELFRYSLIAPLITNTHEFNTINEYCEFIASKSHNFEGKEMKLTPRTIKNWYYKYKNHGLNSLETKTRKDKHEFRKIKDEEVVDRIIELRKLYPKITTKAIYKKLIDENYINSNISIHCLFRYLKNNNLKSVQISKKERKMFEHNLPNDSWQSDTSSGPYILVDGKKYRTYLITIIDDTSRLIVGYNFFYNDNGVNMQQVLKSAIKKYGIPKILYVDNGSSYKNEQLYIITARCGIKLVHAPPYSPQNKGKQERFFRTIKDGWMNCTDWNEFKSLDDVEKSFSDYLYKNYNNKVHSKTKDTPNNIRHSNIDNIRFITEEEINNNFMHTKQCKVYNDSTIRLNNEYYEVPYKYVGKKIEVRYDVTNHKDIYVYDNNKQKELCTLVDKKANSKGIRKNNIDYSKIINNEEDVLEVG